MEIKLTTDEGNFSFKATPEEDATGYNEKIYPDLRIQISDNSLLFSLEVNQTIEDSTVKVFIRDIDFMLDNTECKYLHSFLTTFLKLNPK